MSTSSSAPPRGWTWPSRSTWGASTWRSASSRRCRSGSHARRCCRRAKPILMRKGHPASRRKLTLHDLAKYPLVTLSVGGQEEGAVGGFIVERGLARQSEMFDRHALEEALAGSRRMSPRTRITVPHALAIPALLRDTTMLSIVPASLAVALAKKRRPGAPGKPPYQARHVDPARGLAWPPRARRRTRLAARDGGEGSPRHREGTWLAQAGRAPCVCCARITSPLAPLPTPASPTGTSPHSSSALPSPSAPACAHGTTR
jgi:hypothetical protein